MKHRVVMTMLAALVAAVCLPVAIAQSTGSVKGSCKDMDGKLVHFRGVSDDWIPALTKRFESEEKDALEMLKK